MLGLYGVPVPEADARRLIATLLADGGDLAQAAGRVRCIADRAAALGSQLPVS